MTGNPPIEEHFEDLVFDPCITNPPDVWVVPADYYNDGSAPTVRSNVQINVVNSNLQTCRQAYMRIPEIAPVSLDHHGAGWGMIYFGVILPRIQDQVFQMPTEEKAEKVAIKRLSRAVVNEYLRLGGNENPYKEIQRMDWLGDNHHVLGLVEVLQDDDYLYIITPYCEGGSLVNWIFDRSKRDAIGENFESMASIFLNILENMDYLHFNGVCHRDLSPDNCMVLGNGRIVFNDLAMSFRIPSGDLTTRIGEGFYGKQHYLPPEIVTGFHYFGATACDLWSSAVILFNLVTGEIAWEVGLPTDLRFQYLVMAGGLSRTSVNERTAEILDREPSASDLRTLAEKCIDLNPNVSDLLEGVLRLDPTRRWNRDQVHNCLWVEAARMLR
mmetsp:Transcript_13583/g.38230  ORF Transcript_13583/g.38230 Transcript_13583/m.38230 type:complete len:384 (-) Transcript_13583:265-1416(-)